MFGVAPMMASNPLGGKEDNRWITPQLQLERSP
jgi:hypothetical protein